MHSQAHRSVGQLPLSWTSGFSLIPSLVSLDHPGHVICPVCLVLKEHWLQWAWSFMQGSKAKFIGTFPACVCLTSTSISLVKTSQVAKPMWCKAPVCNVTPGKVKVAQSCLTAPHGLYSPWTSLGQNIGVGSLSVLQGILPTQGSNWGLLQCRRILYQLSYQGSPDFKRLTSN